MKRNLARVDLEIVKRLGHAKGFVVLPGVSGIFCAGPITHHALTNLSSKMIAN